MKSKTIKANPKDFPCKQLEYCPYGSLVEQFECHKSPTKISCPVFGHDCPAYVVAEDLGDIQEAFISKSNDEKISTDFTYPENLKKYFKNSLGKIILNAIALEDICRDEHAEKEYGLAHEIVSRANELDEFANIITDYKTDEYEACLIEDKIPVDEIMRILFYLHDEQEDYENSEPSDQKNHIFLSIEKVDSWLARNHYQERSLAIDKLNVEAERLMKETGKLFRTGK